MPRWQCSARIERSVPAVNKKNGTKGKVPGSIRKKVFGDLRVNEPLQRKIYIKKRASD